MADRIIGVGPVADKSIKGLLEKLTMGDLGLVEQYNSPDNSLTIYPEDTVLYAITAALDGAYKVT